MFIFKFNIINLWAYLRMFVLNVCKLLKKILRISFNRVCKLLILDYSILVKKEEEEDSLLTCLYIYFLICNVIFVIIGITSLLD